jgi:hypothetical protein
MIVYSVGSAKRMTGLSRKEIKKALFDCSVITWSWAVSERTGGRFEEWMFVVEKHKQVSESHTETTLLITEDGLNFIKAYYELIQPK